MRSCWRRLSPPCMCAFVYLGVCVWCIPISVWHFWRAKVWVDSVGQCKVSSQGFQLCSWWFRGKVSGQTEGYCGLSSEKTQAQQPSQSLLPAVLCIIIHSSLQPQTPSSHHLSCCCHSDFESDLSLSCPPVKSTALMGKYRSVMGKKINFVVTLWQERDLRVPHTHTHSIFCSHAL